MEKKELAVGDSTRLEVIFSTRRYNNRVIKRPRIETNEGPPNKHVQITSQVVRRPDSTYPVIIKPYKLDISQFGEKVRDEIKFNITNVSDSNLNLTLIDMPEGLFELKLPKTIEAGKTAQGVLKLHQESIEMSFEKSITIELDDEQASRFTIPVKRTRRTVGKTTAQKSGH